MTLGELVGLLRSSYPNANVGVETVRAYVRLLDDIPLAELEPIILAHIRTSTYFPTVAELTGAVMEQRFGLPAPDEAWARVSASPAEVPIQTLSPPERAALDHVGGRFEIRSSIRPEMVRAQFLKTYEAGRRRFLDRANLASLSSGGGERAIEARAES